MLKTSSLVYKTLVVGVIVLFIGVGIQPAIANDILITNTSINNEQEIEKKCIKNDISIGLGFIFCWTWVFIYVGPYNGFGIPAPFVLVSCTDLDTGEVRYGITFLSFCFFKFLKSGHSYKIKAEVSGFDEVIIKNLQFFDFAFLVHEGLPER